jgi:hypothetical protein
MDLKPASSYLNDHLAGSSGALELLEHLESLHKDGPLAALAAQLRAEIGEEREKLEVLVKHLGITQSAPRKVAGWLAEKAAQVKLKLDDLADESLRTLEILEALSLGIEGKRLLSRSLAAGAASTPALRTFDFDWLARRSESQRERVETHRLAAARQLLG